MPPALLPAPAAMAASMRQTDTRKISEQQSASAPDAETLAAYVHDERLALYYRSLRQSLAAVLANSLILWWLLRDSTPAPVLHGWLAATGPSLPTGSGRPGATPGPRRRPGARSAGIAMRLPERCCRA